MESFVLAFRVRLAHQKEFARAAQLRPNLEKIGFKPLVLVRLNP
jgi:hypothetical protein